MAIMMKYLSKNELESLSDKIIYYEGFKGILHCGILELSGGKYWLRFCGKVNAQTVKIWRLNPN